MSSTDASKIARRILSGARIVLRGTGINSIQVEWRDSADQTLAFAVANGRTYVGKENCASCHLKAWAVLHLIVQEDQSA